MKNKEKKEGATGKEEKEKREISPLETINPTE